MYYVIICAGDIFPKMHKENGEKGSRDEEGAGGSTFSLFELWLSREIFRVMLYSHFILLNVLLITSEKRTLFSTFLTRKYLGEYDYD